MFYPIQQRGTIALPIGADTAAFREAFKARVTAWVEDNSAGRRVRISDGEISGEFSWKRGGLVVQPLELPTMMLDCGEIRFARAGGQTEVRYRIFTSALHFIVFLTMLPSTIVLCKLAYWLFLPLSPEFAGFIDFAIDVTFFSSNILVIQGLFIAIPALFSAVAGWKFRRFLRRLCADAAAGRDTADVPGPA